uniref:Zinc finger protein 710 n=1 Tax=Coturnix japonica TaxID=93934 RepID=A0A8C2YHN0_COTJA
MERFTECGTQTDAVVVLSLAQAAVLGLVSDNELLGATVSPAGFFPGPGAEGEPDITAEPESEGAALDGQEDESLEAECSPGKHARRRKRPPVRLLPKVKREEAETEEFEVAAPGEDEADPQRGAPPTPAPELPAEPSGAVKMIDLSAFSRKPRRLRHLRRHGHQQPRGCDPDPRDTAPTPCAFESGAPSPGEPEAPATPERVKSEQGFTWQEPGEMEADAAGDNSEHSKKAQLDRLDINVQIDDSYLVEAGDRQKRWQCRMCEKSYTSKYNLVTHILGHNGIKPHSCPHCNKLFKQPSHLQTHLLTHQGTRPHKCEVCSKAFTQTSHLKRHMLLHTDIKPYNCRICGRGFAYPSELKAHESKHESGRENICVECGLDFPTLTQLKRHLATHQGPTLYQCLECSKSFHYRSQLQNHMLKHQNVRPFVCTECGMEFSQIHHLKQHSLTHKVGAVCSTERPGAAAWPRSGAYRPQRALGGRSAGQPGGRCPFPVPLPPTPHPVSPQRSARSVQLSSAAPSPPALTASRIPAGREGVQVRGVRARVHAAGQHEAAHAHPHQRPALPVPHLLQDVCAEADAEDPHDCALTGEAIQVQGLWEVLQPHVQPAGPHAPARGQQALQVSLLLQQVQPERQPEPAHEGQAWRDGHQPGQPRSHDGPVRG